MTNSRPPTSLRVDPALVEQARERAGLSADVSVGAVIRFALATLAGADTARALDSTPGRGAVSYRERVRAA